MEHFTKADIRPGIFLTADGGKAIYPYARPCGEVRGASRHAKNEGERVSLSLRPETQKHIADLTDKEEAERLAFLDKFRGWN